MFFFLGLNGAYNIDPAGFVLSAATSKYTEKKSRPRGNYIVLIYCKPTCVHILWEGEQSGDSIAPW